LSQAANPIVREHVCVSPHSRHAEQPVFAANTCFRSRATRSRA